MITKIMRKREWEVRKTKGEIIEASLQKEGFIHCSFLAQSLEVAEKHFSTEMELVLLIIDTTLIKAEVKYESAANGQEYPHIYGALNVDAVVNVVPFHKENGAFTLPPVLENR